MFKTQLQPGVHQLDTSIVNDSANPLDTHIQHSSPHHSQRPRPASASLTPNIPLRTAPVPHSRQPPSNKIAPKSARHLLTQNQFLIRDASKRLQPARRYPVVYAMHVYRGTPAQQNRGCVVVLDVGSPAACLPECHSCQTGWAQQAASS